LAIRLEWQSRHLLIEHLRVRCERSRVVYELTDCSPTRESRVRPVRKADLTVLISVQPSYAPTSTCSSKSANASSPTATLSETMLRSRPRCTTERNAGDLQSIHTLYPSTRLRHRAILSRRYGTIARCLSRRSDFAAYMMKASRPSLPCLRSAPASSHSRASIDVTSNVACGGTTSRRVRARLALGDYPGRERASKRHEVHRSMRALVSPASRLLYHYFLREQ
jgi:hypothetical protein